MPVSFPFSSKVFLHHFFGLPPVRCADDVRVIELHRHAGLGSQRVRIAGLLLRRFEERHQARLLLAVCRVACKIAQFVRVRMQVEKLRMVDFGIADQLPLIAHNSPVEILIGQKKMLP